MMVSPFFRTDGWLAGLSIRQTDWTDIEETLAGKGEGDAMMRRAYILVAGEYIAKLAQAGEHRFNVDSKIPASARFHSAYFEPTRNAWLVAFEDDSFPLVEEGKRMLQLPDPVLTEIG